MHAGYPPIFIFNSWIASSTMPNTSEVDGVEPRETRLTIPILSALRKQLESEPLMLCGYSSTATEAQLAESQQTFGTESFVRCDRPH